VTRRVTSSDGTSLALFESGTDGGPVVVAVHGYPDNHTVWDGLAAALGDTYRVVTYDVRGAGESGIPASQAGYRIALLIDDLVAVLDAVAPGAPVHLVAHDWGSIQAWAALGDPRLRDRVATFISISGPSLQHARVWLRGIAARPGPRLRQLAHSYYTLLFQLPRLPELAVRRGLIDRAVGRRSHADQTNGINLYRANMLAGMRRTVPARIEIPVLVLAPEDDPFVTPALATEAPAPFVADLLTLVIPGEHWVVKKSPDVIAGYVREFINSR
jgi:pimeloyl-ACP methyl ester carboxylesterase